MTLNDVVHGASSREKRRRGSAKRGLFSENILQYPGVEDTLRQEVELLGGGAAQTFLHADVQNIIPEALAELALQNSMLWCLVHRRHAKPPPDQGQIPHGTAVP